MTDRRGTFEHACFAEPRPEHGYCTDDMARVLVVATREPDAEGQVNGLAGLAVRFLNEAQAYSGACRNRMDRNGHWTDEPTTEDHWGRCIWGLGTAAAHSDVSLVRRLAVIQFERAAQGTVDIAAGDGLRSTGRRRASRRRPRAPRGAQAHHRLCGFDRRTEWRRSWPWPEPRLTYANAVLAEAMIAAGVALDDATLRQRGLDLLAWLIEYETGDGHLSPTPVAGRGADDVGPAFDQQPIEVATLADACARAAAVDAGAIWPDGVVAAAAWFQGANDAGQLMWDPETGGGFDGLHADGVNRNQGAESTLAAISTLQHARCFSTVPQ